MFKKIDGICFKNMVDYAFRNLKRNVASINKLNVFPVPDGDTGTNMATTLHKALKAVGESVLDLPSVSKKFANAVVFEARGNSGVILSQFLKGISERFYDVDAADGKLFIEALENGVEYAYMAVASPVEGTMLTVIKDATQAVKNEFTGKESVDQIIDAFLVHARRSLEKTPELLDVLKENGVVDSGGAGIVYLFEGMKKYLDGETIEEPELQADAPGVDYDRFHSGSAFEFGYCTELLLQLLDGKTAFTYDGFFRDISRMGESLVLTQQNDKVRIHIHTFTPEKILEFCHSYGEFLSVKIENMSVQHAELQERILCSNVKSDAVFAVVAVAPDFRMQKMFVEMGADVAICAEDTVSTKDYLEAFQRAQRDTILVFPNSSDAILSALQAKKLCHNSRILVVSSRSVAECYSALPTIDFTEENVEQVADSVMEVINQMCVASIAAGAGLDYPGISDDSFYAYSGKELVATGDSIEQTLVQTITTLTQQREKEIVTIFFCPSMEQVVNRVVESLKNNDDFVEFYTVLVDKLPSLMTVSFE